MTTAYTPILQLALPVTGELNGTWGTVVNDNITSMIEQAIAGLATINTWTTQSHTLTTANGTTDEARCAVLECSGAPGGAATVICPTVTKLYVIKNSVTGGFAVTLKTAAGTGISVPNGSTALLYCDGTNVVSGATYMATVSTTQVDILAQGDLRLQDTTGGEYVALQAPATLAASYTLTLPVDDGTAGQALVTDGNGVLSWSTAASGDVYGPASATDNAVARFDLTTGKLIQNSVVTIADTTGNMAGVGTLGVGAITTSGALTYGGVTLNNAVTGTGNMVLSTSPTLVTPALGTPASGIVTNLTGTASININGTVGATTPAAGAFTTLTTSSNAVISDNSANAALRIIQLGAGNALLVEDSANPDATPFVVSAAGLVGIGTTAPSSALDIGSNLSGGTFASQIFSANNSAAAKTNYVKIDASIALGSATAEAGSYTLQVLQNNAYKTIMTAAGALFNNTNYLAFGTTNEAIRIVSNGTTSIGGIPGAESLRVTPVASAVNYINIQGNTAGGPPALTAQGSDTNINLYYAPKGTGSHLFANSSGAQQFVVSPTASAVNYLQVTGNSTGGGPILSAQGSDTNITVFYSSKGTGSHNFVNSAFAPQFVISPTASAVNYLQVAGGTTGNAATLFTAGSDTNIDITLTPKGSGYVVVDAAYSPNLTLTDAATIAWDTSTAGGQVATFTFVSSNRTMGAPTNLKNGGFYALAVIQNAGSNTLTWASAFKWAAGTAPTLSTAAGAKDYFVFRSDGTNLYQQGISQAVA